MMDFGYGSNNGNGSGDEQEAGSSSRKNKKHYYRHSGYQIQQLDAEDPFVFEEFFKECQHPDDNQRRQLSRELGLESKQIKFWFQNKRTQTKAQNERADNNALKVENDKIQCENLAIREALKNVTCPNCGGPPFGEEERQLNVQKLKMQNSHLKQEHERMSHLIANFLGKPFAQIQSLCSMDFQSQTDILGYSASQGLLGGSSSNSSDQLEHQFQQLDDHIGNSNNNNNSTMQQQMQIMQYPLMNDNGNNKFEMEKMAMIETAVSAMGELMRLLRVNEPLWIKSSSPADHDGDSRRSSYLLHRDSYNKLFPRSNHFKSSTARMESSKDSGVVSMSAVQLLNMFLDSNKWVDLFPTIVTKARTIEVVDTRMLGDQAGSLQLMYEQMHILSPLVAPREFYFLRYCREVEASVWVIVDVSYEYDCSKLSKDLDPRGSPPRSWRLPSGCMLQDKPNGCCEVTWVEHVEVDDKSQTHRLYKDLVCGGLAYGAQRWLATLHRMSERLAYSIGAALSRHELGGVFDIPEGRKSIMNLSQRMVKNFWEMLSMSDKLDFPHLSELNNSGVRVSVRQNNEIGQPSGMIVSAASSLWLPLSSETLFNFFTDEKTRHQWDMLSNGNPVNEIAHVSYGTHPGNCISIIQSFASNDNNMLMLQESCIEPMVGSVVVYAPIDLPAIKSAVSGDDSTNIPILPLGLIISDDGRPPHHHHHDKVASTSTCGSGNKRSGGSLLTVAFQILVSNHLHSKQLNMESVATLNTLVSSTVQKIKAALDCSNVD
ncbi:Homeobox-leucine zipper protein ROC8 [Camellia lanceoleosa]|uniref:Homeobox-leucine zipper protein ROC8 n=1 Tax=Camellia lanceoleosa TaxID=1840588 RepID=A0ACC0H3R9_9ERIC|nr:Homeobox-leucine zipper protein ROC8 [Camellia lanceoleosa]